MRLGCACSGRLTYAGLWAQLLAAPNASCRTGPPPPLELRDIVRLSPEVTPEAEAKWIKSPWLTPRHIAAMDPPFAPATGSGDGFLLRGDGDGYGYGSAMPPATATAPATVIALATAWLRLSVSSLVYYGPAAVAGGCGLWLQPAAGGGST